MSNAYKKYTLHQVRCLNHIFLDQVKKHQQWVLLIFFNLDINI